MKLGAFSISLTVSNLAISAEFYKKLGFSVAGGNADQNWLVLRNGPTTIGLFQGMFPKNMMTFNPGWGESASELSEFTDIRELQAKLESQGIELTSRTDESSSSPASIMLTDPDGNPILIDQHVPRPSKV